MVDQWSIGDVARRTGVAPSALRYYEAMGLLPPAQRVSTHRRYDARIFQHLARIQFAQQAGFTVAEMQLLWHGFPLHTTHTERWHIMAAQKLPQLEALITRATDMKRMLEAGLACDCVQIDACPLLQEAAHRYEDAVNAPPSRD